MTDMANQDPGTEMCHYEQCQDPATLMMAVNTLETGLTAVMVPVCQFHREVMADRTLIITVVPNKLITVRALSDA